MLDRVRGHCGFCPEADVSERVVGWGALIGRPESSGVGLGIQVLPPLVRGCQELRANMGGHSHLKSMVRLSGEGRGRVIFKYLCPRREV